MPIEYLRFSRIPEVLEDAIDKFAEQAIKGNLGDIVDRQELTEGEELVIPDTNDKVKVLEGGESALYREQADPFLKDHLGHEAWEAYKGKEILIPEEKAAVILLDTNSNGVVHMKGIVSYKKPV